MLTIEKINEIDSQGMYKVYDQWPKLAKEAFESILEPINIQSIDHIVFAGMGGSGAIGDLFASILSKDDIHVNVVKGYLLPKTVDKNTLVVCTSVSGNTIETLTILETASKLDTNVIAFSSGGNIEKFCQTNNVEFRKIPKIHSPRASFATFVYSILQVLNSILPINKSDVLSSLKKLEEISHEISTSNLSENNPSLKLAEFLEDTACIYYPFGLYAAAIRFKSSLQENSKMHAFVEDVIEACHNGIVSWEKKSNVKPVLIRGTDDYIKTKERWEILERFLTEKSIEFIKISSIEGDIFSKMMCLIYLLDFATIYRAVLNGTNPSPVKSIDYIKEHL